MPGRSSSGGPSGEAGPDLVRAPAPVQPADAAHRPHQDERQGSAVHRPQRRASGRVPLRRLPASRHPPGTGHAVAAGVQRIVYTSSVATLGVRRDRQPADETTPVGFDDMIGHYKRSKYLAEQLVLARVRDEEWPVVIVNPSTPIGPRDVRPTPTGRMVLDAARGKLPAYVDTGLNVVHVDDVAEGHLLAFDDGKVGERYILGGENMGLREILAEVASLAGRAPPTLRLPHIAVIPVAYASEIAARLFGGEPLATVDGVRMARKCMFFSCAKARRDLGYAPRPAREALADAVEWFRSCGYL